MALDVTAPAGATVTLSELTGGSPTAFRTITATGAQMRIAHALPWRCDRRARRLQADAVTLAGEHSTAWVTVITPGCADRFALKVRPRTAVRVGQRLTVTVRDLWKTGGTDGRACLRVRRSSSCRQVQVPASARGVRVGLPVTRAGVGEASVRGDGFSSRVRLEARARRAPLRLLATGDSMIQIIDSLLAQKLEPGRRGRVTSDARISTGISKPFMLDWVRHARVEAGRVRPQATVMFIGANDGFPIGDAACCGEPWVAAYASRVKAMMRDYRRGGAGRVYWLTIPAPRDAKRKPIYHAVNDAIKRAARSFPSDEVSVIDLVPTFTPGWAFRPAINGRTVRQADGIHLNVAGAKIAAQLILRRVRADGLIA